MKIKVERNNPKAGSLTMSVKALQMCKEFINDLLTMYQKKEIGKMKDHASTIALCIGQCYQSFSQNFTKYLNNTQTTTQTH